MESGSILHLALLKKLCSGSPKFNYINKFRTFRTVNSHQSNRTAFSPHTTPQPFQKYPKTYRELNFIRTKSHSLDDKRTKFGRSKMQLQESMNLCGWNADNEQEYNYDKYFKRNKHPVSTLEFKTSKRKSRKESKQIKQKKFIYCQQNIDQFFKQIKLSNPNIDKNECEPLKQKKPKLKPLITEDIKTQSAILKSGKPIYIDKENLLSKQLQLISSHKMGKLRKKAKMHKANDLVREWSIEINHKRIC